MSCTWWSRCLCWPSRPATISAVLAHCSAPESVLFRHRRRPSPGATRTRTGGAAAAEAPRPDGDGDGDGDLGATVAGGAEPLGSGRGGTAADGAGNAEAAAVRKVPASPVRCRRVTRSTRCP